MTGRSKSPPNSLAPAVVETMRKTPPRSPQHVLGEGFGEVEALSEIAAHLPEQRLLLPYRHSLVLRSPSRPKSWSCLSASPRRCVRGLLLIVGPLLRGTRYRWD